MINGLLKSSLPKIWIWTQLYRLLKILTKDGSVTDQYTNVLSYLQCDLHLLKCIMCFKIKFKAYKYRRGKYNVSTNLFCFFMLNMQHFINFNAMMWHFKAHMDKIFFTWNFNCHSNKKTMGNGKARDFSCDSLCN